MFSENKVSTWNLQRNLKIVFLDWVSEYFRCSDMRECLVFSVTFHLSRAQSSGAVLQQVTHGECGESYCSAGTLDPCQGWGQEVHLTLTLNDYWGYSEVLVTCEIWLFASASDSNLKYFYKEQFEGYSQFSIFLWLLVVPSSLEIQLNCYKLWLLDVLWSTSDNLKYLRLLNIIVTTWSTSGNLKNLWLNMTMAHHVRTLFPLLWLATILSTANLVGAEHRVTFSKDYNSQLLPPTEVVF